LIVARVRVYALEECLELVTREIMPMAELARMEANLSAIQVTRSLTAIDNEAQQRRERVREAFARVSKGACLDLGEKDCIFLGSPRSVHTR
jgi:vancomycin permeability regulator SanA